MKLPKCINCNYKLSWPQTFKQTMIVKDPLQCPQCHHKLFLLLNLKRGYFS